VDTNTAYLFRQFFGQETILLQINFPCLPPGLQANMVSEINAKNIRIKAIKNDRKNHVYTNFFNIAIKIS